MSVSQFDSNRKSLFDDSFFSRRYVDMLTIEFENIITDFLLWTMRRMREFDLRFTRIDIIKFSHVEMTNDLFVKLMIISSDIIMFKLISSLHLIRRLSEILF
jgi:hypothetical protein